MPCNLSVSELREEFCRVAAELGVAPDVVTDVCGALDGLITPYKPTGRLPLTLALLVFALGTEHPASENDQEYQRFRAITQMTIEASLDRSVDGYGEAMAGEPQAYGALNAVLVFFLEQYNAYRKDASITERCTKA